MSQLFSIFLPRRLIRGLIPVIWLLCLEPACAQSPVARPVDVEALKGTPLTANDTIAAIQKIFKSRRKGGAWLIGVSAIVVGGLSIGISNEDKKGTLPDRSVMAVAFSICTSPVWVPGLIKEIRFNHQRERKIIADYQRGQHLPPFVSKIIAKGYFNSQSKFVLFPNYSNF